MAFLIIWKLKITASAQLWRSRVCTFWIMSRKVVYDCDYISQSIKWNGKTFHLLCISNITTDTTVSTFLQSLHCYYNNSTSLIWKVIRRIIFVFLTLPQTRQFQHFYHLYTVIIIIQHPWSEMEKRGIFCVSNITTNDSLNIFVQSDKKKSRTVDSKRCTFSKFITNIATLSDIDN